MRPPITLVAALGILILTADARAQDTVILKNGSILDGKIVEETDDAVTLEMSLGRMTFRRDEIKEVRRSGPPPSAEPAPTPEPPAPVAPPPAADTERFTPGMLASSQMRVVDLQALDDFPEAFLGGRYRAYGRYEGKGPRPHGVPEGAVVELGWGAYGFSDVEPAGLVFLASPSVEAGLEGVAEDEWIRLEFTLSKTEWTSPSYGPVPLYVAEVSSLGREAGLTHLAAHARDAVALVGQEINVVLAPFKFGEKIPGTSLVELRAEGSAQHREEGGLVVGLTLDQADVVARHARGLVARIRVERVEGASFLLARVVEMTPAAPFDDPATALLWHRFRPVGVRHLYAEDWERAAAGAHEAAQGRNEVVAHAFDLREPEEVSTTAGQGPSGEIVSVSSGKAREGYFWYDGGDLLEAKTLDEVLALTRRPSAVYHRTVGRMRTGTSQGSIIGPGTGETPTTLATAVVKPVYRRLVFDAGRGEYVYPDPASVLARVDELARLLAAAGKGHREAGYDLAHLESKVTQLENRIEWLERMIARPNTREDAIAQMEDELAKKQAELDEARRALDAARGSHADQGSDRGDLTRELLEYWTGTRY